MKIFNDWQGDKTASFVMFLARESQRQKRKLRSLHKYFNKQSEVELVHIFHVQQGLAAEASTMYLIAKDHFGFTDRKINK